MFSKNQSGSSLNRQLFETYMALDNWHQFRLRLFIEGIFVGIAGGLSISLFRFLLNESEDLRIYLYYACLIPALRRDDLLPLLSYALLLLVIGGALCAMCRYAPMAGGSGIPQVKGDNCRMELRSPDPACNPYLAIGLILAAGLDGIEHRMILQEPVNKNLFRPDEAEGLGLEMLPASLEEAVQAAQESEFLRSVLPEELSHRYYEEELKRCAALKNAADPAEYERIHYFNAV